MKVCSLVDNLCWLVASKAKLFCNISSKFAFDTNLIYTTQCLPSMCTLYHLKSFITEYPINHLKKKKVNGLTFRP